MPQCGQILSEAVFPSKKSIKKEGWNKRGWWANVVKLLNDGINVEGGIFFRKREGSTLT